MIQKLKVDQIIGEIARGKSHRIGILTHPEEGIVLMWKRQWFQVINLLIIYNDNCWTKETFDGHLFLKQRSEKTPALYIFTDSNMDCRGTSYDEPLLELTVYAIAKPNKTLLWEHDEDMVQNIPICLKAIFSEFGSAVALVQDTNIAALWQAEVKAMFNNYSNTDIGSHGKQRGVSNENRFLEGTR